MIRDFRSMTAPASLKPDVDFISRLRDCRFPEHDCSGLIEASLATVEPPKVETDFRSMTAPASLKRNTACCTLRVGEGFPEHDCSGLIEAYDALLLVYGLYSRFPEHDCSGLIEAASLQVVKALVGDFRSMTAPASLKLRCRKVGSACVCLISGA